MRMRQIAKGLGLCAIGFTGGMIFTGYQLGKLALHNDRIRKLAAQGIKDYVYEVLDEKES